jgi:C4-dicarboxylate transporter, DctQ subunit
MSAISVLDRVERFLIGLFGTAALAVGTYQVIGRYVDQRIAFAYGEEVVVYFTVWAVFLATSQLVRTDGHVRPDLVLRLLPPQGQRWFEVFNCCVALAFCGGLTWFALEVATGSFDLDERSSTGLEFPMWIYYASIPVGAGLMSVRYALRLYRYLFEFDPSTMIITTAEH